MDDPKPVEIRYPGPQRLTETGIVIDDETVEGGYVASALEPGDIIEIDGNGRYSGDQWLCNIIFGFRARI